MKGFVNNLPVREQVLKTTVLNWRQLLHIETQEVIKNTLFSVWHFINDHTEQAT